LVRIRISSDTGTDHRRTRRLARTATPGPPDNERPRKLTDIGAQWFHAAYIIIERQDR